jgi:hypothetical protein
MVGITPDARVPPYTSNDEGGQEDLETLPGLPAELPHQASLCLLIFICFLMKYDIIIYKYIIYNTVVNADLDKYYIPIDPLHVNRSTTSSDPGSS